MNFLFKKKLRRAYLLVGVYWACDLSLSLFPSHDQFRLWKSKFHSEAEQKLWESSLLVDRTGFETLVPAAMCSRLDTLHSLGERDWSASGNATIIPRFLTGEQLYFLTLSFKKFIGQVRGLLQAMRGLSSPFIIWDQTEQTFFAAKTTEMISHLSRASHHALLAPFLYADECGLVWCAEKSYWRQFGTSECMLCYWCYVLPWEPCCFSI